MVQGWADFAADEVETWPDIKGVDLINWVDELIVAIRDRRSLLADKPPRESELPRSP